MTARDLTAEDFIVISEADVAMLDIVMNARATEVDYSEFYLEDE